MKYALNNKSIKNTESLTISIQNSKSYWQ